MRLNDKGKTVIRPQYIIACKQEEYTHQEGLQYRITLTLTECDLLDLEYGSNYHIMQQDYDGIAATINPRIIIC